MNKESANQDEPFVVLKDTDIKEVQKTIRKWVLFATDLHMIRDRKRGTILIYIDDAAKIMIAKDMYIKSRRLRK